MAKTKTYEQMQLLKLRPLDRLEIFSKATIQDACLSWESDYAKDLPYWFFQRQLEEEFLEVRAPFGYVTGVKIHEICNVIPSRPVLLRVRHPTLSEVFHGAELSKRYEINASSPYNHEAWLKYLEKDTWGRINRVFVEYVDEALRNQSYAHSPAMVHQEDFKQLASVTRSRAPIISPKRRGWSADAGRKASSEQYRHQVREFLRVNSTHIHSK